VGKCRNHLQKTYDGEHSNIFFALRARLLTYGGVCSICKKWNPELNDHNTRSDDRCEACEHVIEHEMRSGQPREDDEIDTSSQAPPPESIQTPDYKQVEDDAVTDGFVSEALNDAKSSSASSSAMVDVKAVSEIVSAAVSAPPPPVATVSSAFTTPPSLISQPRSRSPPAQPKRKRVTREIGEPIAEEDEDDGKEPPQKRARVGDLSEDDIKRIGDYVAREMKANIPVAAPVAVVPDPRLASALESISALEQRLAAFQSFTLLLSKSFNAPGIGRAFDALEQFLENKPPSPSSSK